jgi:hypothetical protein
VKKTYYVILIFGLFIIFISLLIINDGRIQDPQTALEKAFKLTDAKLEQSEINVWGRLGKDISDYDKMKQLADEIISDQKLIKDNTYSFKKTDNGDSIKIEIKGSTPQGRYVAMFIQLFNTGNSNDNTLSVTISDTKSFDSASLITTKGGVERVLKKHNIVPKVSSCISGYVEGKLESKKIEEVYTKIFKTISARKVEGIRDGNLLSVSAYSPLLRDSIKVDGRKINFNLAARYNSYDNKTYIWLATPIIEIEY